MLGKGLPKWVLAESQQLESEGENAGQSVTILTSKRIGENPEHLTEFISWTDLADSENVRGRMINKYLQDDGISTKTRVDMEVEDGAKRVESVFHFSDSNASMYAKAGFREMEINREGTFQRHEIWGRYYDTTVNIVVQARGVMLAGEGFAVEVTRCSAVDGKDTICGSNGHHLWSTTTHLVR